MYCLRVFLLFFVFSLGLCDRSSKYSKGNNLSDEEKPFRINKVNVIWKKAKKKLSGPKLADLFADLKIQDKVEGELKKLKSEDRDKDGLKEAEVRYRLIETLAKYGLEDIYPESKHLLDRNENEIPGESIPHSVRDKKLQKLWKKAEYAGFSEQELEDLKQEFWHQQMKLDEFNMLKNEMNSWDDLDDNYIDIDPEKRKNKVKKQQNMDLKMKHKDLKSGYEKLEALVEESDQKDIEFKDHRVYELWALARKANMSAPELESFKEELKHFEHRISKHEYYEEQLRHVEPSGKNGRPTDKHRDLIEKTEDHGKKVEKYHTHLKTRVEKMLSKHTEL